MLPFWEKSFPFLEYVFNVYNLICWSFPYNSCFLNIGCSLFIMESRPEQIAHTLQFSALWYAALLRKIFYRFLNIFFTFSIWYAALLRNLFPFLEYVFNVFNMMCCPFEKSFPISWIFVGCLCDPVQQPSYTYEYCFQIQRKRNQLLFLEYWVFVWSCSAAFL